MNLELSYPAASCSILPRTFPTPDGASEAEWFEAIGSQYAESQGELDDIRRESLRRILERKRRDVLPADEATILFRPTILPVFVTIHVQAFERTGAEVEALVERVGMPETTMALRPRVDRFPSELLGEGRKAAFVAAVAADDTMAGFSYLFADARRVVSVFTAPATPTALGILEPILDDIVRTIRFAPADAPAPSTTHPETEWGVLPIGPPGGPA
ncbi:hypothetical protein J7E25_06005 [Agromyces sp. ISL-38]|uniref:hypothetical protein n=1 Tax=Agromyces sp. ISL-38 TaxID=2819107 RepID=UPI001BE59E3E|nr:hypothetical protein [Agromyces sp. ISL-38]MBT2498643.1 hypothetical protein [Agromyces sp. ISL-38]MBT2518510.1 hypothetical protein [Streptomyces sp. ISL-90]